MAGSIFNFCAQEMKYIAVKESSLLEVACEMAPESSKNTVRSWIEQGRITLDGRVVKKSQTPVRKGEEVKLEKRTAFLEEGLKVLYEDPEIVVIDKPEGLLSVATDFQKQLTAHSILKRRFYSQRVFPVHRLDRETSGVLVFAYTEQARDGLKHLFEIHDIEREYFAIVKGKPPRAKGTWTNYLIEDKNYVVKTAPSSKGKLAVTHYELCGFNSSFSRLRLRLETGKKNQIRVQCQEEGCPIVGDKKYGGDITPVNRLCLHAHLLSFIHPTKNKKISFTSSLPEVFYRLVP